MNDITTNKIQGLNYKPMSPEDTQIFMSISFMNDESADNILKEMTSGDNFNAVNIIYKRYQAFKEVMNLPEMTSKAFLSSMYLGIDSPGKAVLFLVDILGRSEGNITENDISMNMYPYGFYDDSSCRLIIDDYIKTKKLKYSEMY